MFLLIIIMLILIMIITLVLSISETMMEEHSVSSPFECGVEYLSNSHMPFPIQFFLVVVIFVVFDLEIVLLVNLTLTNNDVLSLFVGGGFLLFMVLSLLVEWRSNKLLWLK